MSGEQTEIKQINQIIKILEFVIIDDTTHCNIFFTSNYPTEPVVGCGWRTKSFRADIPITDILSKPELGIYDYLTWETGRVYYSI